MSIEDDILIVEAILSDNPIIKSGQSGIMSSIFNKIKDYATAQINPEDKVGSVINLIAPAILWVSGFRMLSLIADVAIHWFGFDLGKIFEEIGSEIKSLITGNKKITPSHIEQVVNNTISNNSPPEPTEKDLDKAKETKSFSFASIDPNIVLHKSAIIHLLEENEMNKQAQIMGALARFIGLRSTTGTILGKVIKWIVMAILAAGGFLVFNEVADSTLGTNTSKSGPDKKDLQVSLKSSHQSILKINPNYTEEKLNITSHWIETVPPNQIENEIIQWAKEIYPDLKNSDSIIENSPNFEQIVKYIQDYNRTNTTEITFMPKIFTSRKSVVDQFIDEVAPKIQQEIQHIPLAKSNITGPKISDPL